MEISSTLVMPISGAMFANQINLAKKLVRLHYKPDLIFGTSGGCITGMILILSGINNVKCQASYRLFCDTMDKILSQLDSSWYLTQWSSNLLVSRIIGLKEGSLYSRGNGESIVNGLEIDLVSQPEMWIGTRCKTTASHQLFCTRSRPDAKIQLDDAIYTNGCVEHVTKVAIASCAVPTIVPGIEIDGLVYCDGGITHASPLGPCSSALSDERISYHIVYISPVRYSNKDDPSSQEIEDDDTWNQLSSSMAGMVRGLHIPDRNNGIRMVGPHAKRTFSRGEEGLAQALKQQARSQRSFIELAPVDAVHINFLDMRKGDVLKAVQRANERDFTVTHWYI